MRSIALDIHHDFCEVAMKEGPMCARRAHKDEPAELQLFALALAAMGRVALLQPDRR